METIQFTETHLAKIEPSQLEAVVNNSGLAIIEADEIKQAYLPYLVRLTEIQSQASKINFETPAEIDETIARELRLKTVKIRTEAEKLKDDQKRVDILRGKVKQDSFNLISSSCKLAEGVFFNVEKAREIEEKKRKENARIDRAEKLSLYTESSALYPLGEMSEEQFNELYSGLRIAHENKITTEKKAEEDRIASIEAERVKNEKIRLENIHLQKEAEEREKQITAEREKSRKEQAEKDRIAEIEHKKQAQILANQKANADKERAELLAKNQAIIEKAEKERKEKEQLLTQIEAGKQAAIKASEAEKKAKIAAEKKAKLLPEKTKLLAFGQALNNVPRPEIKTIEAAEIMANINGLLIKLNNYIITEANKL